MFILELFAHVLPFYRASQDAGIWLIDVNRKYIEEYVQAYVESKGVAL